MTLVPLDARDAPAWVVRSDDGRAFAVFPVEGGGYRVTDAVCPHNRGPLEQGWVRSDGMIVCPWHWYRFDVDTGRCATNDGYHLGVYAVVERDGAWFADVGDPPAALSWSERLRAHARGDRTTDADPRRGQPGDGDAAPQEPVITTDGVEAPRASPRHHSR